MKQLFKIVAFIIFVIITPASYLAQKLSITDENIMLFRMTINICYYTLIISVYFIATHS